MLLHEKPETVLILHGGAGGMIHEVLKYPVSRIDYVELDPLLLKLVRTFTTPLTQSELSDRRVTIHDEDGRFFIKKTPLQYDVILIGLSAPQELQSNRLFTSEFFSMAKDKMTRDGMIVLTLPGSLTYISPDLRDLNGCVLDTLRSVFQQVRVIPGDVNLYLASNSDRMANATANDVIERFQERKIKTRLFTEGYIRDRLQDRWLQWFHQSMGTRKVHINSDDRPLAVFYSLSHWNALFSPYLAGAFKWFEQLSFKLTFPSIALVHTSHRNDFSEEAPPLETRDHVRCLHLRMDRDDLRTGHHFYVPGHLRLPVSPDGPPHRRFYGRDCHRRSLHHTAPRHESEGMLLLFLKTEAALVLFAMVLPFLFSVPSHHLEKPGVYLLLYAVFLTVSFISGLLIGVQFPLAARIYLNTPSRGGTFGHAAGLLYGADLFGGFFGGLFGGVLFLPVLGLKESCFTVAAIKASSFLLFLLYTKIRRH